MKQPPIEVKINIEHISEIPLRYYKGWTIVFNVKTETFSSPILSLFGFSNSKDLEKAMDFTIEERERN